MTNDAQDRLKRLKRLRRLGLRQGVKHIPLPPPKPPPSDLPIETEPVPLHFLNYEEDLQHAAPIEEVIPGAVIENAHGQYFCFEARYPLTGKHGHQPLSNLLEVSMSTVAAITADEAWHTLSWGDVLFIDLETTGLEIAAGTVAFLIGMGYLDGDDFVVRQVFMRDFNEEVALLSDLDNFCRRFRAVASFNGRTFDLPVLDNRFVMARLNLELLDAPHLDLLHPSRKLWRRRLENCRLATIEAEVLGIRRSMADVPGYFIPSLYRKYLVDHDARAMAGIFYHNEVDIVSMASLAALLARHFNLLDAPDPAAAFDPVDMFSVGLWQQQLGNTAAAEAVLNQALQEALPDELQAQAKTELAYLLKRQDRREEAEPLWQDLVLGPAPLLALEELAKFYEWHRKDFDSALTCITYALQVLAEGPQTWQTEDQKAAWEHRRGRVEAKLEKQKIEMPKTKNDERKT